MSHMRHDYRDEVSRRRDGFWVACVVSALLWLVIGFALRWLGIV